MDSNRKKKNAPSSSTNNGTQETTNGASTSSPSTSSNNNSNTSNPLINRISRPAAAVEIEEHLIPPSSSRCDKVRNPSLESKSSDDIIDGDDDDVLYIPPLGPAANAAASMITDEDDYQLGLPQPAEPFDRMGDDGYPLVVDLGTSDRQSRIARQRLIEEVIQEQAFDQDVIEELKRVNGNMRRVFGEEDDENHQSTSSHHNNQQHQRIANPHNLMNVDNTLTPRVEAAIANYMVRKYTTDEGKNNLDNVGPSTSSSSDRNDRAVNILPASRHLIQQPLHNLIAIGRRPRTPDANTRIRNANAVDETPLGWQAAKSSLRERISYMYCNELLADVYFIVGREGQRIPAHKFVLSIGSVVFDAMFNGGLTPHNSREPLEIELPDVEPSAFLTLLKFLYSDDVIIGPESVMTTLYTAKKYAVPAMETACVEFLKQSLNADNAFMLLTQARLFDEPQLAQLCLEIIDKNTMDALNGEGFTDIDIDTLCLVLSRDSLRVAETPLFQAVVRWATEECIRRGLDATSEQKRSILSTALPLIRFPLMTINEFAQFAAQSGLLTDHDIVQLFLHFTVNPKPPIGFNDRPRCAVAGKELVVQRFQRIEGRWGYSGTPDRIKFTVDRMIYVVGFGLYGAIHGPFEYKCKISIIHCGTGKILEQNETTMVCDGSSSTFRVCFNEPVEIMPSVTYIASAQIKGVDSYYGTKGLRRIVHTGRNCGVTFQFTYAAGNNNGTSVEDGQIPEIIFFTKLT